MSRSRPAGGDALLPDSDEVAWGVEGVAAWWAAEPGWWVEFWDTGGQVYSPVGMVEESVMPAAERDAVFDAGGPMINPVHNVMDFAPPGRYRTAGKGASAVSDNDCAAYCGGVWCGWRVRRRVAHLGHRGRPG